MRIKGLNFIPKPINFSSFPEGMVENLSDNKEEENQIDKELLLLRTLSGLDTDKERCIFLLEILREYGYQIDYRSIAHSLGIQLRWFMRVKALTKKKVQEVTNNQLKKEGNYGV